MLTWGQSLNDRIGPRILKIQAKNRGIRQNSKNVRIFVVEDPNLACDGPFINSPFSKMAKMLKNGYFLFF